MLESFFEITIKHIKFEINICHLLQSSLSLKILKKSGFTWKWDKLEIWVQAASVYIWSQTEVENPGSILTLKEHRIAQFFPTMEFQEQINLSASLQHLVIRESTGEKEREREIIFWLVPRGKSKIIDKTDWRCSIERMNYNLKGCSNQTQIALLSLSSFKKMQHRKKDLLHFFPHTSNHYFLQTSSLLSWRRTTKVRHGNNKSIDQADVREIQKSTIANLPLRIWLTSIQRG